MTAADVLSFILVPMGLLPVMTAIVLFRHINAPSLALKERARLSLVLAFLGVIVTGLALNRLLGWGWSGEWLAIPFGAALILVDVASGLWLVDYFRGKFGETELQREDREEGVIRRGD